MREFVTVGKGNSCAPGAGLGSGKRSGFKNEQKPDHFRFGSDFIPKGRGEAPLEGFKQEKDLWNAD